MTKYSSLSSANSVLTQWLRSNNMMSTLRPHMAKALWAEAAGPAIAAVTQVERIEGGNQLVVYVLNNVWANELTFLKGDILAKINEKLGGKVITDIRFKGSGLPQGTQHHRAVELHATPEESELASVELSQNCLDDVEKVIGQITHLELQERVKSSLERVHRMAQWKREHGWLACSCCGTLSLADHKTDPDKHRCSLCHAGISPNAPICRELNSTVPR